MSTSSAPPSLCPSIKQFVRLDNFLFKHKNIRRFTKPQWDCIPFPVLICFRLLVVIYLVAVAMVAIVDSPDVGVWFAKYATMIYFVILLYMVVSLVLSVYCYRSTVLDCDAAGVMRVRSSTAGTAILDGEHWSHRVHWALANMALPLSLLTVLYWVFEYSPRQLTTQLQTFVAVNLHGVATIVLLCDFVAGRLAFHFSHSFAPMFSSLFYVLFHVCYLEINHVPLYNIMDHAKNPAEASAVYILMPLMVTPACHAIWVCIYELRDCVARRLGSGFDVNPKRPSMGQRAWQDFNRASAALD